MPTSISDGGREGPEGLGEQVADGVDVAGHPGDEVALLPAEWKVSDSRCSCS